MIVAISGSRLEGGEDLENKKKKEKRKKGRRKKRQNETLV